MAVSEKQKQYAKKWDDKNLKRRTISFRKDEYEALEQYCNMLGLPINRFCRQVLMKAINYNKGESDL